MFIINVITVFMLGLIKDFIVSLNWCHCMIDILYGFCTKILIYSYIVLQSKMFLFLNCCYHEQKVLLVPHFFPAGEGLPHTAATHLVSGDAGNAVFILGQTGGTLLVVKMFDKPFSVFTETIKNASLMNRLFTGFVPGMFRLVLFIY